MSGALRAGCSRGDAAPGFSHPDRPTNLATKGPKPSTDYTDLRNLDGFVLGRLLIASYQQVVSPVATN